MNFNEAISHIKRVGASNARVVPSDSGQFQVEIRENGNWALLECTKGMTQTLANELIVQATNRVILG